MCLWSRLLDKRGTIFKQLCGISCTFIFFAVIAEDGSLQQATLLFVPFVLLSVSMEQGFVYWKMCRHSFEKHAVFVLYYCLSLDNIKTAMLHSHTSWIVKLFDTTLFPHMKIIISHFDSNRFLRLDCFENWFL